jgi:hypothetical protein
MKRLLLIACQMEHHNAVAAVVLVKQLLQKYPRLLPMLDNDVVSTGT